MTTTDDPHVSQAQAGGTDPAPEGMVYQCMACGKRARTRYGFATNGETTAIDHGWDEACMMHARLTTEAAAERNWNWVNAPRGHHP